MASTSAADAGPASGVQKGAAGGPAAGASSSKRERSHSLHGSAGGAAAGAATSSHGHGGGGNGWIRVGRNGKPLFHQHPTASSGGAGAGGSGAARGTGGQGHGAGASQRDPVSAVAATTSSKWRRHGHRIVRQPAHPAEPRSRSSSTGAQARRQHTLGGHSSDDNAVVGLATHGTAKLSASARRRLKRRQRRIEAASAALTAAPAAAADDDDDEDDGVAADSSDDFVPEPTLEASHHASPGSAAATDTRPTTAYPTPSTLPRGGSLPAHPPLAATVTLRPHVRCTDGMSTTVRTLTDIMRSTAAEYELEADTPIVRPADPRAGDDDADGGAAAGGGGNMPALSLGAALEGPSVQMEQRHPSANDLEEGYSGMHHHPSDPNRRSPPGGARYLTVPPSAFTVDSIATPNTYAAMPHGPMPPPIPERQTYQNILHSFDAEAGTFAWHADETAAANFAAQLELLCEEVGAVLRARPLLRTLEAPAYVLGDIHGNFADLSFFLKSFLVMNDIQLTPCQVLCLGDYVDRGPHSVECVALLFALCLEAPDRVVLLRGNHEDRVVCGDHRTYGDDCFWAQCCRRFGAEPGTKVFRAVTRVFKELPLACELQLPQVGPAAALTPKILCTHGGFPRFNLNDPETFRRIELLRREDFPRFLTLFPNNPLAQDDSGPDEDLPDYVEAAWFTAFDLMWSDPTTGESEAERSKLDDNGFCCNMRGLNVMSFSQRAVEEFLKHTGYAMLFRAHQEKQFGLRLSKSSKVLTLFSSSNYQGHGNGAGCAVIDARGHVQLVMKS